MKTQQIKLRLVNIIENIIDLVFPKDSMFDKMKNATCRFYLMQNQYRLDDVLNMFADQNGEIDIDELIRCYDASLFDNGELKLDLQRLIPLQYEYIKSFVPQKIVVLKRDEIYAMLKQ